MNKLSLITAVITAVGASATVSTQALAQNTEPAASKLEEMVVTSSRIPTPLRQIGTSVSVISQEEIELRGFNSLTDILRSQPGVGVSNQGGAGGVSSLRIRGEENFRTKIFLDDIDISDTSSPQTTPRVEQLLSSGIERVEILRGPQGLLYGADAGGVINITTISAKEGLGGQVSAEGGKYGTQQFAGNVNGGNETVDFSLSATDYETDGFNATTTDTDLGDDDGYENTTLHGRFGWNVTEDLRLSLVAREVQGENKYDGCLNSDFANSNGCSDEYEQQAWRTAVDFAIGRFNHEVSYSNSEIQRDFSSEGALSFYLDGELERSGYLGSFKGGENLTLVFGVDLETQSIDDGFTAVDRDQTGYYLEYQGGFSDQLYVTAGVRYDDNDDFGTHTSYRLSGAYLIPVSDGEIKLRATYGTGFRAPSLNEIALNQSPYTGPPAFGLELSEENSEGFDLGVSYVADSGLYLEAVYFDQTITDEIFYDFNSYGYLQSDGDSDSTGIELIGELPLLEELFLTANYTYTDSQTLTGEQRPRRPEHTANAGLKVVAFNDTLVLAVNLRMSRDAVDVDGTELDNYEVVDFDASYTVTEGLDVYGRVENLFDEDYEEIPTYNTSGAAGYVGLRYSF
ncbi:MAG: vitamin B12 transporter [Halioglobus sp.]|jgi:vitamin B12 transporter